VIVCVSLNPAIDTRLNVASLERGQVNRASSATPEPGGKSLHVAMVLRVLGADPLWIGLTGGTVGKFLADGIRAMGIRARTIEIAQPTRTNLEIVENDGAVTEILEPGPAVTEAELERLQRLFESELSAAGTNPIAVLCGSLPRNVPEDFYAKLIRIGHDRGCRVFLDTSGEPLRQALNAKPDLVKPNQHEAEWTSEFAITDPRTAQKAAEKIFDAGAAAVAISMGAAGIVYRSSKDSPSLAAAVPIVAMRSSTASGDAAMAGFAFASERGLGASDALRLAAACGTANCLADGPAKARAADIERLKSEIEIRELSDRDTTVK
jgi:1-phosphofructokinase family hexose kinase